ncbi:MAG: hypothetical protein IPM06_17835 [Rhizobiales bacterium]|nr:hypothetical protein [Hyphomicrobiales bacterium]
MTISSDDRVAGPFAGNGVTVIFPFTFKVFTQVDLRVIQTDSSGVETDKTLTTHYTVSLNADQNVSPGGSITMLVAPPAGHKITITTALQSLQQTDLTNGGGWYPQVIEDAFDKLTILVQQVEEKTDRAITVPISSGAGSGALPNPLASSLIGWNAAADGLQNFPPSDPSAFSAAFGSSAGAGLVGFSYSSSYVASTVGASLKQRGISVMDAPYSAAGDGVTNDATAIQAAIDAAAAVRGSVFFPAGTYLVASAITLKPGVILFGLGDSQIKWNGGAGSVVTSGTSTILTEAGIIGIDIDSNTATKAIDLFSPLYSVFRDIRISSNSATQIVLDVQCNSSGETNSWGNRNAAFNNFDSIYQDGIGGTGLRLQGDGPTDGPAVNVVTLNSFRNVQFAGVSVRGFDFAEWADNNYFDGNCYANLIATNAVGCEMNTADPTGNRGVYSNAFSQLAVDAFAGAFTGRVGLKLNNCKNILVNAFYQEPVAEGGDFVASANAVSYRIGHHKGGTNSIYWREVGTAWTGGMILGKNATTETVALEIGSGRSGNGISHIDLIGDATYTDYGARISRQAGANGATQIAHRGTGNLEISQADAGGGITLSSSGGVAIAINSTGIGFNGASPVAKPTITGSRGGNAALASLLTGLATSGHITNSTTA